MLRGISSRQLNEWMAFYALQDDEDQQQALNAQAQVGLKGVARR